ncbi:short-chain dehydrogenase reductase sdr [Trichoderma arundinaceum]|uniref:Short-chain dehydrogenase reductase sdr n=1 Tax=Trichoderma arundinaceum TaxID=490622 RepID=A0A395N7I3_TRIAR|nr:short-chain dehydrogenase reductase sdr [Trichoderma arundinaceum]
MSAIHGFGTVLYGKMCVTLPIPTTTTDLSKQIMVVTGSNCGLGFESTRHLSRLGVGRIIMAVRTLSKGEAARKEILESTGQPDSSIEVWPIDMDSHDSVKTFAERASLLPRLDGVLANAGIKTAHFVLSEGSEKTLNVNVINTFLLFYLLLPAMLKSEQQTGIPCRFVIPNSALHYMAPLGELDANPILDRLNDPKKANMGGRYPFTKLLVVYVVREIAERTKSSNKGKFIINTPNPSWCKSELSREVDSASMRMAEKVLARTTEEGSRTLVHGLLADETSNGHYLTDCHVQVPAKHVTNQWGQKAQKKFFDELVAKLESVAPGITYNL